MKAPDTLQAAFAALETRASEQGLAAGPLEEVFERFLFLADRYARLEKMVLGSVPLQFPAHLLLEKPLPAEDPVKRGVHLARRERQRLDLEPGGVADLEGLIEQQGVKVIGLAAPGKSGLAGAFLFHELLGPAILVNARLPRLERDYALIHEYGHFLADNDPYETWVCRSGLDRIDDPAEIRAHAFAGAFLVPEGDLDAYLEAAGRTRGQPLDAKVLRQLRAYFEADDRAIVGRLLTSGWLEKSDVARLLEESRDAVPPAAPGPGVTLPARFVSLAVLARREGKLTLEEMAHYLDVDETTARRIESSFSSGEEQKEDADSSD